MKEDEEEKEKEKEEAEKKGGHVEVRGFNSSAAGERLP